jgi:hypothetical protein
LKSKYTVIFDVLRWEALSALTLLCPSKCFSFHLSLLSHSWSIFFICNIYAWSYPFCFFLDCVPLIMLLLFILGLFLCPYIFPRAYVPNLSFPVQKWQAFSPPSPPQPIIWSLPLHSAGVLKRLTDCSIRILTFCNLASTLITSLGLLSQRVTSDILLFKSSTLFSVLIFFELFAVS